MNTFKLALASWLSFAYPFLLFATTFTPLDSTSNFKFYADSTNCQASVNVLLALDPDCFLANYAQSVQIDLDIQDMDEDGQLTTTDIISDIANPSEYIIREEGETFLTGNFPIGEHALLLPSMTNCNDSIQLLFFSVLDTIAPKPRCKLFIEVQMEDVGEADLDQDGQIDYAAASIPVIDMLDELSTDCTGQLPPDGEPRRIVTHYSANWWGDPIDPLMDTLILTCPDLWCDDLIPAMVNAWDEQGNRSACTCWIFVTGLIHENRCVYEPRSLTIEVQTIHGEAVPYVEIELDGDLDTTLVTNQNGWLEIQSEHLQNLTITPRRNTAPTQGITTFDLTLLRRHILGTTFLVSPWRLIAADVNQDQRLTIRDIIELQRLLLGIQTEFSNNTSWRFFDDELPFANPNSPWEEALTAESIFFEDGGVDGNATFYAVKIGDLNESVSND